MERLGDSSRRAGARYQVRRGSAFLRLGSEELERAHPAGLSVGRPLERDMTMTSPDTFNLGRFRDAQDRHGSFTRAMTELRAGRKTSHWIWWVFPQVRGLGSSPTSVRFAMSGRDEAIAYLTDETLRSRLLEGIRLVHEQLRGPSGTQMDHLMGSEIDALKLVSSMTLFAGIAGDARVRALAGITELRILANDILEAAQAAGYPASPPRRERAGRRPGRRSVNPEEPRRLAGLGRRLSHTTLPVSFIREDRVERRIR
jgi:uncharacterized protein (DUF1810 family)